MPDIRTIAPSNGGWLGNRSGLAGPRDAAVTVALVALTVTAHAGPARARARPLLTGGPHQAARLERNDLAALRPWFSRLRAMQAGRSTEPVRVVQLGDSHTAAQVYPRRLSAALGGDASAAAPGLLPLAASGPLVVGSVRWRRGPGWRVCRRGGRRGCGAGTPLGLGGVALRSGAAGSRLTLELSRGQGRAHRPANLELFAELLPGGGTLEVRLDGRLHRGLPTRALRPNGGPVPGTVRVELPAGSRRVELVARGDGPVLLHGVALDSRRPGVTWDVLGVNGATAGTPLGWDEAAFAAELARRDPALVVLAYGSNEAGDSRLDHDRYVRTLRKLVARVRRGAPQAACLLVGPPDRARKADTPCCRPLPSVRRVAAAQRQVARETGCAFWDTQRALGGEGTACRWAAARPALAQRDGVHLTRAGYRRLADALAGALLDGYARSQQGRHTSDR